MNSNAMQMIILPILHGVVLGTVAGVVALLIVRAIGALMGLGHGPERAGVHGAFGSAPAMTAVEHRPRARIDEGGRLEPIGRRV